MGNSLEPTKRKSLAECHLDLELICQEIDSKDGEITDDLLARFDNAQAELAVRVDNWIDYLDATKTMVEAIKERKDRIYKAYKVAQNLQERLRQYLKFQVQALPDVPLKGENGKIYLHKSPKALNISFPMATYEVRNIVTSMTIKGIPSLAPYLKDVTYTVLDKDKLKKDLEAGMEFPWANITQDSHIRIKG